MIEQVNKPEKSDLNAHWIIVIAMALTVVVYVGVCHYFGPNIQIGMEESQRVLIRSVFYVLGIIVLPFTSLLRHILLRLNQTMPGDNPAKNRYLVTIAMTQSMVEIVAVFGLVMFVLGDEFNTLYIFSVMAGLGMFLHRPKMAEYLVIVDSLIDEEGD